ncbi:alpha/beta hydrolase [Pseudalkalibacillus salsuginis]|uniref:alpha/beta hydrolase n=1 Tax=Pseudalkalibacillus salsuginis TaxID=2910972 RepID=UPI001F31B77E|nr:alpha/beta fold hydrolase [Pseudalkalibacillus salsuginis]MCF6410268.1 alpha/beta fold hydrolase [Pseudalkalibacillus salsuginis]
MIGCLCLHGFTGSPYEVEPLVTFLKANTDWLVVSPTFPGHDIGNGRMERVTYQEWIQTAEMELRALQRKCDKIYVVGFSMGGIIAGYLAASNKIDRLVLLSAAAHYVSVSRLVQDIKSMVQDLFKGNLKENGMFQRYLQKFKDTPLSMTFQFRSLIRSLRPYLKKITTPTLIIQGECDGVVPKKSAQYIYNTIRSKNKEIILLPKSKHIVCHDVEQEDVIRHVYRFLTDTETDEVKGEVTS